MAKNADVVVIGAGLAGLSATLELQSQGVDVVLLEASDRTGGRVASDYIDGFICDRGFQLINSRYPSLIELDVLDEIDFVLAPRVIEVSLGTSRHIAGDPRKAPLSTLDKATGTIPEKFALLRFLLFSAPRAQTIGGALSRFGTLYEHVLRPFLTGVFLCDPELVDFDYGVLIIKSFVNGAPGVPRSGVGRLPEALAKRVQNLELHTRVERIIGQQIETTSGVMNAKKIVVATDPTTAAQLLDFSAAVSMAGCITWYHATASNPSGTGRLIVDGQNRGPIINSVVMSDISIDYSDSSMSLVSSTSGLGVTESDARRHLSLIWGCDTREWQLVSKYEIASALPIHLPGKAFSQPMKISENIFVSGDHRSVPSQQGALFSGKLVAQLVLN
jgi:hypothetical protein